MKYGTRALSAVLALLMCLSILPLGALAEDEPLDEDIVPEEVIEEEEPAEEPEEEPAEEPVEEPAENLTDEEPADSEEPSSDEEPAEEEEGKEPAEEPAEEPVEEPVEEPEEEPAEEPAEEPTENLTDEEPADSEEPSSDEEPAEEEEGKEPALDGANYDTSATITLDSSGAYSTSDSAVAQKLWDYFYYSIRTEAIDASDIEELNGYGCQVDLNKDGNADLCVQIPWTDYAPSGAFIGWMEGLEYMRNYDTSNVSWGTECSFDGDTYKGSLTVNFTPVYHIVQLNMNGGTTTTGLSIVDFLVSAGSDLDSWAPKLHPSLIGDIAPRDGYYPAGCFLTNPSDDTTTVDYSYVPTGDVTLYMCWTKLYTVTLDGNGGKFASGNTTETLYVFPGDQLYDAGFYGPDLEDIIPADLDGYYSMTRDGYFCTGFSDAKNGPVLDDDLLYYTPTGDVTLYAHWSKAVTLTIAENFSGGGKWTTVQPAGSFLHAAEDIAEFNPRAGYVCTGYTTDYTGKNPVPTAMEDGYPVYLIPDQDAVWYCKWSVPGSVSITSNLGGGSESFAEGETVDILNITAAGKGLTYQWQQAEKSAYESLHDAAFQNVSGATKSFYEFTMTADSKDSYFRCVVKDSGGSTVYSKIQLVRLWSGILTDPVNFTGPAGQTATFTVKASGRNKSYEWHAKKGSTDVALSSISGVTGGDTATLSVPITAALDKYLFWCTVTTDGAAEDSSTAYLYVGSAIDSIALTVSPEPADGNFLSGVSVASSTANVNIIDTRWSYSTETPAYLADCDTSELAWTTTYPSASFAEGYTYILSVEIDANSGYGFNRNTKVTVNGKALSANRYHISTSNGRFYAYVLYTLKADISKATVTGMSNSTYTGSAYTPVPVVKLGNQALYRNDDYTVSYKDNVNAGTATLTITGTGNYTGTVTRTFTIGKASLSSAAVTVADAAYTGSALTPAPTVKLGSKTLTKGTDYTVSYKNNTNPGTATVTITGTGNYSGSLSRTFTINKTSLSAAEVSLSKTKLTYNGKARKPAPTVKLGGRELTKDTDYTVTYKDNKNAGTATVTITGTGGYTGTATATFTIKKASLASATLTLSKKKFTYSGKACEPAVTVVLNGKTLEKDTDYTVTYKNNVNAGKAAVTVKGTGNYKGKLTQKFTVKKAANEITVNSTSITKAWSSAKQTVKLGVKRLDGAKITYSSSNSKIAVRKGKAVIPANFVGKTTITIKAAATDNYKATTLKVTLTVRPAKVTLKSVTAGSKKLTVKWTKSGNTGLTGYQIQYSTSKKFTKATTTTVTAAAGKASKTISKLTAGKTYYVRIRAYQEVGKTTYYSAWSAVKNAKVTK